MQDKTGQENQIKLDYSIESAQERTELVRQIIESLPPQKLTNKYLQILADYIIFALTKSEKKSKNINTQNRMITINKRQVSMQGLAAKFQNGQNGAYHLFIESDKNIIFTPKISITEQDIEEIPGLRELRQEIQAIQKQQKTARGKRKYLLTKQLIQMRQDQYVMKMAYKQPIFCLNAVKNFYSMSFDDNITIKEDGTIIDNSLISFMKPKHVSALLCNYSRLKQSCAGKFYTDGYYMMQAFDNLVEDTLKEKYPLYFKILIYKIDGRTNIEIQQLIQKEFDIKHSVEYLSALWRQKIPKLIAKQAEKKYLIWYFTNKEKGKWKRCSRCGQVKLAHNHFFSKNGTSKDGFYSICKDCRNEKKIKPKSQWPRIVKVIPFTKE